MLHRDARATVRDFQERTGRGSHATDAQLDGVAVRSGTVLHGVLTEIPDDLAELRGIDLDLDITQQRGDRQSLGLDLHGRAEFFAEPLEPVAENQALGTRVL